MNKQKRQFKAIISDYDGTLTNGTFVIPEGAKQAILEIRKNNFPFLLASGRLYAGPIEDACRVLKLEGPQITKAGAEIVDAQTGNVLSGEYIPDNDAQIILSFLKQEQFLFHIEQGNMVFTRGGQLNPNLGNVMHGDLNDVNPHNIPKICVHEQKDTSKIEYMETFLHNFFTIHVVQAHSPYGLAWDITAINASKQTAVPKVAEILGISTEEIIGVGDGYNDFPLLMACGLKVAMGNAVEDLKAIADYVAPSVDENGIVQVIKKFT